MNTITTNVPGPQTPLYCLGREMLECYPFVMLAKNIRVTTAIFSYNGNVYFGVTGDYDAVPDVGLVGDGIEGGVAELLLVAAAHVNSRPPAGDQAVPADATDLAKRASAGPPAHRKTKSRPRAGTARAKSTARAKGR
jgi:diacylglycerol O-acyltransferase